LATSDEHFDFKFCQEVAWHMAFKPNGHKSGFPAREEIDSTIVIMAEPNESMSLPNYFYSNGIRATSDTNPFR